MKNCISCGQLTEGSIGAAGYCWNLLCQTCKDSQDATLALQLKAAAKGARFVVHSLGLGEQPSDLDTLSTKERMEQFTK